MSIVKIAFYTAKGDWVDKLVRLRTGANTSHVSLVVDGLCYSSSPRDGGVRCKKIELNDDWETFSLSPFYAAKILAFFEQTKSQKYDWASAILGQGLGAKIDCADRWTCSEWCAAALGFTEPWRYSPVLLRNVLWDRVLSFKFLV